MPDKSKCLSILIIILLSSVPAIADEYEEEDDSFKDLGEDLGTLAIFFLVLGTLYIILRRLYSWSRNWSEDKEKWKSQIMNVYREYRQPLLIFHNITMIAAVIVSAIHGISLLNEGGAEMLTGVLAWVVMVLLSVFGFIIYYRVRPIWDNRSAKNFIRFIHKQWILSVIMLLFLGMHLTIS